MEEILDPDKRFKINLQINPVELLRYLDYFYDKIQVEPKTIRAFCPVHKDEYIRTLKIDLEQNVFKCSFRSCPGNTGGDLLDLLIQSCKITERKALLILTEKFNIKIEFSSLFKDKGFFFEVLEQKVADSDWDRIPPLVQGFMGLPAYADFKNKQKIFEILKPVDLPSLQEKIFHDIWQDLQNAGDYQKMVYLAEKFPHLLKNLEQFDSICSFLEKEGSKEKCIKSYQQKANWLRHHDGESPEYYQSLIKIVSLDSSALGIEDGLRLLEYYTGKEKIPGEKVKKLADVIIERARKDENTAVLHHIQNILINHGMLSPEDTFPYMQARLQEEPQQTFSQLEALLNNLSTDADKTQAADFLKKNALYISLQAPSPLLIMSLHVLLENGYFDSPKKRGEFLKHLQKRSSQIALNSQDSIFVMERLMAVSSGEEKTELLYKIFEHFYNEGNINKIQETASELFSILTQSKETDQMESLWKKFLKKSETLENYEWLYQKAVQYFIEPLKMKSVKLLYGKLPAQVEFKILRLNILRRFLFDYEMKNRSFIQEYLNLIVFEKQFHSEPFPLDNFFGNLDSYWKDSSLRETVKECFMQSEEEFRSDFAREMVLKLEEFNLSEDAQFWLVQYLKLADSGEEPFFYIDKASLLLKDYFDRDIFDKTLRELQEYSDSSHMVRFIKIGYEFYLKNDDWPEVKKLFESYGSYIYPDLKEIKNLLKKAQEKQDAAFFIWLWDKYFSTFEQYIEGLSSEIVSYCLENIQPDKLSSLLHWFVENKQIEPARKVLDHLLNVDSNTLVRKGLLELPHAYLTAKLEKQYIHKLQQYEDISGILEYYRGKINYLLEKELFSEARNYCEKIRLLVPEDLSILELSAELEEKIGNLKKAMEQYEQMYEIYTRKELFQDAHSVLEKMYRVFPEEPGILKKRIDIAEKIGDETAVMAAYQDLGTLYEKNGDINKAVELYSRLYKQFKPAPVSILKKLFKYSLVNKKALEAKHYLMELLPLVAEDTSPEEKLKYIQPVLSLIPDDLELMILYAEKMLVSGRKREAYHFLKQAGEKALRQKKTEHTIAVYEKIVQLNPSSIAFHARLGKLYSSVNMPQKSLAHYNEAARICYGKKRLSDAMNLLKQGLNQNSFDLDTTDFLSELYIETNKLDKALPLLIEIAEYCEQKINYEKAFIYFYNAVRIAPDNIPCRLKVLRYARGNIAEKDLKPFYQETLSLLYEKKEVSLLQEWQEEYFKQFGIEPKLWKNLLQIYIEEKLTDSATRVLKALLDEYMKNADSSSIVEICKQYLEKFSPYPGLFSVYLPSLYRETPEQFYREREDWQRKYAAIPEYMMDLLETVQSLYQNNPNDYHLLESNIRLLCKLGETDAAWSLFAGSLQYATENGDIERFLPFEEEILPMFQDKLERFSELIPLYTKDSEHFIHVGRKITGHLVNERNQKTALQLLDMLKDFFPDDIELNVHLLHLYQTSNDEISLFNQSKKLASLYEKKGEHKAAYNLYEKVYQRERQDSLEEKLVTLLVKQGEINAALDKIEEFSQKAMDKDYDLERARVLLEKGRAINPDNLPIYKKLLTVKKRLGVDSEDLAPEYFALADQYKKEGAWKGVRSALYEAVQANPACSNYWMHFLGFLQEQKKYTDIFRYIPQCLSSLSEKNEIDEVLASINDSIQEVPLEVLISVLDANPDETADNFEPFIEGVFTTIDRIWEGLAYSMEKGKLLVFSRLFRIFSGQIKQNTDISNMEEKAQKMLAFCLEQGFLHESMEIYRMLVRLYPESIDFLRNYIEIGHQLGVPEKELVSYRILLADAFMNSEKPENAIKIIERLYHDYPNNLKIKEKYVEMYPMLGMEEEVVDKYRALARSYKEKDPLKARYFWQKVYSLFPEDEEAKQELFGEK